jgi:hypothetical protein
VCPDALTLGYYSREQPRQPRPGAARLTREITMAHHTRTRSPLPSRWMFSLARIPPAARTSSAATRLVPIGEIEHRGANGACTPDRALHRIQNVRVPFRNWPVTEPAAFSFVPHHASFRTGTSTRAMRFWCHGESFFRGSRQRSFVSPSAMQLRACSSCSSRLILAQLQRAPRVGHRQSG